MRFAVRRTRIARPRNEIRKEGGTTARRKVAGGKSCGEGAERGTHGDARTGRRWSLHPDDCRLHRHAFGLGLASVVRARALRRTHVPFAVSGSLFLRCIQFSCRKKGLYSSAATIITLHVIQHGRRSVAAAAAAPRFSWLRAFFPCFRLFCPFINFSSRFSSFSALLLPRFDACVSTFFLSVSLVSLLPTPSLPLSSEYFSLFFHSCYLAIPLTGSFSLTVFLRHSY